MSAEIIPFPIRTRIKAREALERPRLELLQLVLPGANAWPEERRTRDPVPAQLVRQFLRQKPRWTCT